MKTFLSLIKVSINANFGISALKYRFTKERKKLWEPLTVLLAALIGLGSLFILFTAFYYAVFVVSQRFNEAEVVLTVGFLASQFFLLFFGVFHIISAFYFSKDLDFLIPLPLKPYQILGSKLLVIMLNEYLVMIPIVTPAIIIYGVGTGAGIFYWIRGLVSLVVTPVIPLIIGAFIVVLLMRFVNIRRSKDIIVVIASFVGLLIGLGVNFYFQRLVNGDQRTLIEKVGPSHGLIKAIGQKFPPSIWATHGLSENGLLGVGYFSLFIITSVLLFVLLLWIGNKVFYKGVISGDEVTRKRKVVSLDDIGKKHTKVKSPVMAIFIREFKVLLRTPVFMMNGLSGIIMMPVMLVMASFTQEGSWDKTLEAIKSPQYATYVSLGALALMLFTSGMNIVSSTAFSREGKTFWVSKMIPVSPRHQVMAKLMHAMVISVLGVFLVGVLMVILVQFSIAKLIVLAVLALLGALIINSLDLIVDILHPKLDWTNPHEAVKTNLNGLFGLMISMVFLGVLVVFGAIMAFLLIPEWFMYICIFVIESILLIPSLFILFRLCERRYKNIEV